jgi:hypothetical protein
MARDDGVLIMGALRSLKIGYEIRLMIEGQLNLAYFELLAEVINPQGKKVGLCVVELLPGAGNPHQKMGLDLFKKV